MRKSIGITVGIGTIVAILAVMNHEPARRQVIHVEPGITPSEPAPSEVTAAAPALEPLTTTQESAVATPKKARPLKRKPVPAHETTPARSKPQRKIEITGDWRYALRNSKNRKGDPDWEKTLSALNSSARLRKVKNDCSNDFLGDGVSCHYSVPMVISEGGIDSRILAGGHEAGRGGEGCQMFAHCIGFRMLGMEVPFPENQDDTVAAHTLQGKYVRPELAEEVEADGAS